jgi:putative SOS response-associated peptidase YedK
MFRDAFRRRRCLVVADGFYEWRENDEGRRTLFFFRLGRAVGFVVIWSLNHARKEFDWLPVPSCPTHRTVASMESLGTTSFSLDYYS